ncbi:hypothetical protein QNI19_03580 [Cytophagaceae bacterium DM2B3-1]|uniref:Uncharacterized protein n=1 Tax=Xanthocytophaga flava TaxID=3048013 RepID=A0ABT7CE41_9BACT|nr:hypothetical protein [Xanthocytophaga flavus]MDJ1491999.1 hypothetical protein [Xanthocytophaga flavus]
MFSFLFKKKTKVSYTRYPDKTWEKKIHKYTALCELVKQETSSYPIVVTFFSKTRQEVKNALENAGLEFKHLESIHGNLPNDKSILLISAELLMQTNTIKAFSSIPKNISFHFAEHYPKSSVEENYLSQLNQLPGKSTVHFYNAIEEPFFLHFGGERIIDLLTRLGVKEQEFISHKMIDNSIQNGQKKIDKKVQTEIKATSAEDWFSKNIYPF